MTPKAIEAVLTALGYHLFESNPLRDNCVVIFIKGDNNAFKATVGQLTYDADLLAIKCTTNQAYMIDIDSISYIAFSPELNPESDQDGQKGGANHGEPETSAQEE